jgi:hypothetical protein
MQNTKISMFSEINHTSIMLRFRREFTREKENVGLPTVEDGRYVIGKCY